MAMVAATTGGFAADYAFNLGLTRSLDPHAYGDVKVAFAFAQFFGLAVLLGGDRAAPMVLVPFLEREEPRKVWAYLRFYILCACLLSALVAAVTLAGSYLHVGKADVQNHHPLVWVLVAIPLNAVAGMVSRTLQAARRPGQAALPWRIGLPLLKLGLLGVIYRVRGELGLVDVVLVAIAAVLAITLVQGWWVVRLGLVDFARDDREPRGEDVPPSKAWLVTSLPMMGSFLIALALGQSDIYFLEALGDEAEVGHYAAAATAAHLLLLVQTAVIALVAPLAKPAIDAGPEASRKTYGHAQRSMLLVATPVALALAIGASPVLGMFGAEYRSAHAVLVFLTIGTFVWATAAIPSLWLQYQGRASTVLAISGGALLLDSALNLLLIPRYGVLGAAGGTALTLSLAAGTAIILRRRASE